MQYFSALVSINEPVDIVPVETPLSKIYTYMYISRCDHFARYCMRSKKDIVLSSIASHLYRTMSIFKHGSMNPLEKWSEMRRVNGADWITAKDLLAPLITSTELGHRCILSISVHAHPSSESPWRDADRAREARKARSKLNCAEMGTAVGWSKAHFR